MQFVKKIIPFVKKMPAGIFVSPEYSFRDLNLKYAGKTSGNDRYYVSLYGAADHFRFSVKQQEYEDCNALPPMAAKRSAYSLSFWWLQDMGSW